MSENFASEFIDIITAYSRRGQILDRFNQYAKGESFILSYLLTNGKTALPSEISNSMGSSAARIATILGELEKKGLITREVDRGDRRKVLVAITDSGKDEAEMQRGQIVKQHTKIFEELGEEDTRAFMQMMKRYLELSIKVQTEEIK